MGPERPLTPRNVVIADRHPVVLQGLTSVLERKMASRLSRAAALARAGVSAILKFGADIAIIDIAMPGLTGPEIITIAKSEGLSTRVVLFHRVR